MPLLLFQLPSKIYIQFQVPCLVLSSGQDLPQRNHMNSWALVLCSWARLISTSAHPLTDVAPGQKRPRRGGEMPGSIPEWYSGAMFEGFEGFEGFDGFE
ncbi:MAG TPA: hypothetical protein DCF33_07170 [Saprospirales bacterium]|nr:hypothetical protein [Saprospirales bacterium]